MRHTIYSGFFTCFHHKWRGPKLVLLAIGAMCLMTACGGGDNDTPAPRSQVSASDSIAEALNVPVKEGYLVFRDQQHFDAAIQDMRGMRNEQRNKWRATHAGFTPVADAFMAVSNATNAYFAGAEKSESSITEADAKAYMYKTAEKNKSIVHIEEKDNGRYLQSNISDPPLAALLNHLGLVEIGGQLFQYSSDKIRSTVPDADKGKLLMSKFCPVEQQSVGLKNLKTKACINPIEPDEEKPLIPLGDNDGYSIFRIEAKDASTPEGASMKFRVTRMQNDPNSSSNQPSYYTFSLLDSIDSASKSDLGLISVSGGAKFIKSNGVNLIQVAPGSTEFEFSVAIVEDYTAEDIETVSITINGLRSLPGLISANTIPECNGCQNWDETTFASVKKDGIEIRDFLLQQRRGDKILTQHLIYVKTLKLNVWGNWVVEPGNIAMSADVRGNKRHDDSNWGDGITHLDTELIDQFDDAWDIPHVDYSYIRAVRTGGKHGVDIVSVHGMP